ncbi:MAG: hypothetical protein J2P57_13855, partial [Acidimicrobiaceae bacterium]|nr:hypothetical protein [Acidimicrobiaceae bacterium]
MRSGSRRWALVLSVVASAALVAGVVTVTVAGSREPAAALHLMFGDAWLSNGRTGTASHVNGYTGITDARARVGSAGDPFQVVERQDGAYVLDLKTGRLL